jgi:ComF family protein
MVIKNWFNNLIELIFPAQCLGCKSDGVYLCSACCNNLKFYKNLYCPVCKKEMTGGQICIRCKPNSFLDGVVVATQYEDKLIDKAIHFFKYKGIYSLAQPLSFLLVRVLRQVLFWEKDWVIIPIPLHSRRERYRGFNQSKLLAEYVASSLELENISDLLIRKKYTYPQMKLDRADRQKNIKNAFIVNRLLDGKKVILIDDVMTSGSTLEECAKVLKQNGVKEVWGAVIARGA